MSSQWHLSFSSHYPLSLKNANPARQEQARLEVENAEDDLVQKTEVAITMMKTVLENVRAILHLIPSFSSVLTHGIA